MVSDELLEPHLDIEVAEEGGSFLVSGREGVIRFETETGVSKKLF